MDGETLIMLTTCALVEQLRTCGLHTVKHQLYLWKLVSGMTLQIVQVTPTVNSTINNTDGKPTRAAMKAITEDEEALLNQVKSAFSD